MSTKINTLMKTVEITYLDHSGFALAIPGAVLVFDYYRDPQRALPQLLMKHPDLPVTFFVSHHHQDHFNPEIFSLAETRQRTYIISDDTDGFAMPEGHLINRVSPGSILPDLPGGITVTAFGSTDEGVSFLVESQSHITIFHAGDLNDWHWQDESTPAEVNAADAAFDNILSEIASVVNHVDIAMFPVDPRQGSDYARGARKFLHTIPATYFIPMHFDSDHEAGCDSAEIASGESVTVKCMYQPGESATLAIK